MRKYYLLVVFVLIGFSGCAKNPVSEVVNLQSQKINATFEVIKPNDDFIKKEVVLKINTDFPISNVQNILTTKNKDFLLLSHDKFLKLYDHKSGKVLKTFIGDIGNNEYGEYSSAALDNDEKYLAIGGYFNKIGYSTLNDKKSFGLIRIYDFKTGKVLKSLKSHESPVGVLSFDNVGKYLFSTSMNVIKIWDAKDDFSLHQTLSYHTGLIQQIKYFKKNNIEYLCSLGDDNLIVLYNLTENKIQKAIKMENNYRIQYMDISKEYIAISNMPNLAYNTTQLQIFDLELNPLKLLDLPNVGGYNQLSFSPNGKFLMVSGIKSFVFDTTSSFKMTQLDENEKEDVNIGKFLDNDSYVVAKLFTNKIFINDINSKRLITEFSKNSQYIGKIGMIDDKISFGTSMVQSVNEILDNKRSVQKYIDFKNSSIEEFKQSMPVQELSKTGEFA